MARAPAFHLDGREPPAGADYKIHLAAAFAPVIQFALPRGGGVGQMRPYRRLHQPSPELAVFAGLRVSHFRRRRDQGCVQHLEFGAGRPPPHLLARVFPQAGHQARARQQIQIMGQRGGVARILKLAQHFAVGKNLPGVGAADFKNPAQQRRLVHARQQQHIAREGGLDERVQNVTRPAHRLPDERRRAGVGAVKKILLQRPAERPPHFAETPMRQVQRFKATGEAFAQAALNQQRSGAEQNDFQWPARARVGVPQALDGLGPLRNLLHFVEDQQCAFPARFVGQRPRRLPLLLQPIAAAQSRFVRAGIAGRQAGSRRDLPDQRSLAHLPRPGDDLDKSARLFQAAGQFSRLGAGRAR